MRRINWLSLVFWTMSIAGVALLTVEVTIVAWVLLVWGSR